MCPLREKMTRMAMVGVLCLFGLSVAIGDSPQRGIPALRVEDPARVAEVIRLRALADARRDMAERGMDDPSTCAPKNCSMAQHGVAQTGAEVLRLQDRATRRHVDDASTCASKNCSMAQHGVPQTGAEVLRLRDMATNHTRRGVKRPCTRENSFVDSPKRFVVFRSTHALNDTLTYVATKKTPQSRAV